MAKEQATHSMLKVELKAKQEGYSCIVGIDEAGRGPLAGPVVASAVYLFNTTFRCVVKDSKKMSLRQREIAFQEILNNAVVGIGIMSEAVIDEHNILKATIFAMENAVRDLITKLSYQRAEGAFSPTDVLLLVDGSYFKTDLPYAFRMIVKGDSKCLSIACASIIAKVTRDRILAAYDTIYPEYGFKTHKGYPTQMHRAAILQHGFSDIHRKSFQVKS